MPTSLPERPAPQRPSTSLLRRLVWFVAIWAMSVGALGIVASVIKLWIVPS